MPERLKGSAIGNLFFLDPIPCTQVIDGTTNLKETVQIAPLGTWKGHHQGEFTVNSDCVACAVAFQNSRGIELAFDYDHASIYGASSPASGFSKVLENRGEDGLWARPEWTEKASQLILSGEYKYLSPVLYFNIPDPVEGKDKILRMIVHSVALTNTPFLDMAPVAAHIKTVDTSFTNLHQEDSIMVNEWIIEELFWLLGLPAGSTLEDAKNAITAMQSQVQDPANIAAAVSVRDIQVDQYNDLGELAKAVVNNGLRGLANRVNDYTDTFNAIASSFELPEDATPLDVSQKILELQVMAAGNGQMVSLSEFNAMKAEIEKIKSSEHEKLVDDLIAEGKLTPAQRQHALSLAQRNIEDFKAFANNLGQQVNFDRRHDPENDRQPAAVLSGEAKSVAAQLGVSDEAYRKYYPENQVS